ncbi:MAG: NepR family anti-sigma factor [Rhodobacteraceae bacterium]|jgi:archaellum biogenesis protein FlaJ (TadC family)|nr:NepR family anti-sigma factor [Paracoccaceae bacterium]
MSDMTSKPPNSRIVEEIDRNLKQAFDHVANEPVPDRFSDLLNRLKSGDFVSGEKEKNDKADD